MPRPSIGILAMWTFVWIVWYLYKKEDWSILTAGLGSTSFFLSLSALSYLFISLIGDPLRPSPSGFPGWLAFNRPGHDGSWLPARQEPHHKSPLPVPLKTLLIFVIVLFVVLAKSHFRGFMISFPYVTVFAVYESSHSLYTLARRMPSFILPFLPVLLFCRYLPAHVGFTGALIASWICFIPLFLLMDRFYTRRDDALLQSAR